MKLGVFELLKHLLFDRGHVFLADLVEQRLQPVRQALDAEKLRLLDDDLLVRLCVPEVRYLLFTSFDDGHVLFDVDVRAIPQADITKLEFVIAAVEHTECVSRAFETIDLCQDSDCALAFRIDFFGNFQTCGVLGRHICATDS